MFNYLLKARSSAFSKEGLTLHSLHPQLALVTFSIFILTQLLFSQLESARLLIHLFFAFLILLLMLPFNENNKAAAFWLTKLDLIWLPAYFFIAVSIIYFGFSEGMFRFFIYTFGILFLIVNKNQVVHFRPAFIVFLVGAIVYAASSVFQVISNDTFTVLLSIIVDQSDLNHISSLVKSGYHPGLALTQSAIAGGYMVTGLAILYSRFYTCSRKEMVIISLLALFLLAGLLLTGKRSILIWAIISCGLVFLYGLLFKGKKRELILILLGLPLMIACVFLLGQYVENIFYFRRFTEILTMIISGEVSGSVFVRFTQYSDAWKLFVDNPLLGVGWDQFKHITSGRYEIDYRVHNVYLQLLAETGLLGFTIIAGALFATYYATIKIYRQVLLLGGNDQHGWLQGLRFALFYQTFFLLYCVSENPFYHLMYLWVYFFAVSIVSSYLAFVEGAYLERLIVIPSFKSGKLK